MTPPTSFYCDVCENNKMTRQMRRYRYEKETKPGSRLFCDVWGPYRVKTPIPGVAPARIFLSVVDEASGASSFLFTDMNRQNVMRIMIGIVNTLDRRERTYREISTL